ncbi:MAG: PAS domain S-box protein [Spirochaetes bacterium]|jgi:PAS domain S-box-containing protein|nr:PAS domain S-box protein [Spirochaetota bacterium]
MATAAGVEAEVFDELVRASSRLSREFGFKDLVSVLVEQAVDISGSELACLYIYENPEEPGGKLKLYYQRGRYQVSRSMAAEAEFVEFLEDSDESLVVLDRGQPFFADIFLHPEMSSGIALPLSTPKARIGVLVLNSKIPGFYGKDRFYFLDSFTKLASGMLDNRRLFDELKEQLRQIESLERYQENVFSSMTNLLITVGREGHIEYFNEAAAERLKLTEEDIGTPFARLFKKALHKRVFDRIEQCEETGELIVGIEGIYRKDGEEMDYSLNISPLKGKRGRHEGITLLFADQTKERELKKKMNVAVEERRYVKDMFARYLSNEVVQNLMDNPELIKPGGDKKIATVLFADIRGYTSFSENKEPEYIIGVLNEYFSQAVEVIVEHRGYIDKFIGDAIMAAWGVPMMSQEQDAELAVTCALEMQKLVSSRERTFFRGDASKLRVGIGMHTGELVAGNLGSSRRMDYSVIGDTVNVAARLEGVAGPGEVVITRATKDLLGSDFRLEEREPVKVKGKNEAIQIFKVKGRKKGA